jgi:hypothetical protein
VSELKRTEQPDQPRAVDQPAPAKPTELRTSGEPYAAHLDKPVAEGEPTAREVLDRFDPRRANLPDLSASDAVTYIETHAADRPWLARVRGHDLPVQRLFATLDQGQGHALERHEGYPSDPLLDYRVRYLQDPAQLDLTKRLAAQDAFTGKDHRCASSATKIGDPEAFATAFARAVEHPDTRQALQMPFDPDKRPDPVEIPLANLLGPDGHRYCSGYRLVEVGGSMPAAMDCRSAWVDAYRAGRDPDVPAPRAVPIDTFEGGTVRLIFTPDHVASRYEVLTMYAEPPDD